MTDNEMLLALSDMLDSKLKAELEPMKQDIQSLKNDMTTVRVDIESVVKPQIQLLAENYVPAAKRYEKETSKIEAMQDDIAIIKEVLREHSEKLQQLA